MIKYIKKWLGVDDLSEQISRLADENNRLKRNINTQSDRITKRISELDDLTAIDVDVGVRGPCTVILSGVYRGKGYVSFYELSHDEFRHMVEDYRERRKHGVLRNIDSIPSYRGGAFTI